MDNPNSSNERALIDFVSSMTDAARLRVEENLPHGFVRLKVAEAERRQAQHDIRSVEDVVTELARNSRDAGARNIFVAFQKEQGRYRKVTVLDDGCGIPEDMHKLVFEPRVTSKRDDFEEDRYGVHGRGMALFSISSRADSASIVSSIPGLGTVISLTVDTEKVPERSDQATLPRLECVDGCEVVGPGPHNAARVLLEMSVDSPELNYFLGSFSEVLATARYLVNSKEDCIDEAIWSEVARIDDACSLAETSASKLGLPISERNAYRVLAEEIAPLDPIYRLAKAAGEFARREEMPPPATVEINEASQIDAHARSPLKRLGKADMDEIAEGTYKVVEQVVEKYYLRAAGTPKVRKGRGKIIISFYVTGEDGEGR
jgi:hypothetical protein